MLVSILTPSFNQGRWLGENLRSVAAQSHVALEQIVMDGGSTDNSKAILSRAEHNLRWYSEADRGQTHALNKAFRESRGAIVGWLNSDDAYFDANAVASAVTAFEENPSVDVVYGHAVLVNADSLIIQTIWVPRFNYALLRAHNFLVQPAVFVRRAALQGCFVREAYEYSMDRELWLRLAQRSKFLRINRVLAIDRHHPSRKSLTRLDLRARDMKRVFSEYGVPYGRLARSRLKILKVAFRLVGLSLVRPSLALRSASGLKLDGAVNLVLRQACIRRRDMPLTYQRGVH